MPHTKQFLSTKNTPVEETNAKFFVGAIFTVQNARSKIPPPGSRDFT
jgi:hypothetical protein